MLCSEYVDTIVPLEYFENLKADNISIDIDIVERAKKNNADAIHAIGCKYASIDDNEKAIDWLGISAAMAFPESQLELGHLFANFGDPLNQCRLEWYFRARENGVTSASFYIASTLFGLGLYFEAKKFYQEAADLGDAKSQFYLGFYYYSLWDIPYLLSTFKTDKKLALEWFLKSAKQGHGEAAYFIGCIYENGEETPVDKYHALEWYHKSTSVGYASADDCIDQLRKQGYFYIPKGYIDL